MICALGCKENVYKVGKVGREMWSMICVANKMVNLGKLEQVDGLKQLGENGKVMFIKAICSQSTLYAYEDLLFSGK